jgi:ATP-dependent Lhr-like helicase
MGGAQFASPGSDELLRRAPNPVEPGDAGVVVLAASDPANAYGSILRWPATRVENVQPQRGGGARVLLLEGQLLAYLGRTGNHLLTFSPEDPADEQLWREKLSAALASLAKRTSAVLVGQIDGAPAGAAPLAADLARHGFVVTQRGLLHRGEDRYARQR